MEPLQLPKPRRNQDALRQAAESASVRTRLRPSGAEFQVRVAVLNGFTALGTPITEVAG